MNNLKFNKQFHTYDKYAIVQKKVAKNLISYIENKNFNSILELGCGTGVFTKEIYENLNYINLDLNDIFDTKDYLKNIQYTNFFVKNMEELEIKYYDLIVSSSAFQWVNNLEKFIYKLSQKTKTLIFSIYLKDNLIEINNHFNISLNYLSEKEIYDILRKYFQDVKYKSENIHLNFSTPLDALKHLKKTGVTGFSTPASFSKIKNFPYKTLTYKVGYFIANKNN